MKMDLKRRFLLWAERVCLAAGVLLLIVYVAAMLDREVQSKAALATIPAVDGPAAGKPADPKIDFRLWSEQRIHAYMTSLKLVTAQPLAVLTVERLGLRVPVYGDTDDLSLNRGAGWIAGTALPGQEGNIGIAGHRDGFFRVLRDIKAGDDMVLTTPSERFTFSVDEIVIVAPDDVSVLQSRAKPSLTLVTCYPFFFVGDAPQRFIVHSSVKKRESVAPAQSVRPAQSQADAHTGS